MKALLYCNKKKPYLSVEYQQSSMFEPIGSWNVFTANRKNECGKIVNEKIVAEIEYDVEDLIIDCDAETITTKSIQEPYEVLRRAKTCDGAVLQYLRGHNGKAYIVKNLKIFKYKPPLTLSDDFGVQKAVDGMRLIDMFGNEYKLLCFDSEELCEILNCEQTIIIRKR